MFKILENLEQHVEPYFLTILTEKTKLFKILAIISSAFSDTANSNSLLAFLASQKLAFSDLVIEPTIINEVLALIYEEYCTDSDDASFTRIAEMYQLDIEATNALLRKYHNLTILDCVIIKSFQSEDFELLHEVLKNILATTEDLAKLSVPNAESLFFLKDVSKASAGLVLVYENLALLASSSVVIEDLIAFQSTISRSTLALKTKTFQRL